MSTASALLPLGALAAGFGLLAVPGHAQTVTGAVTLPPVLVQGRAESDANSLRATTSTIGKGEQALRDIPQSITVVTEKLLEDRRIDTLKEALHNTAGISFMAAEGGEEDIRIRGFSLAASGDIYVDSLRDPAFYERDTFSYERIELLRGSASMLFGRGSTGGVVNQVHKQPFLADATEVAFTAGTEGYLRFTGDFNVKTGAASALRVNVMNTTADGSGNNRLDKQGLAPTLRWGIGTPDEFTLAGYYLRNDNGIHYGLPWLRRSASQTSNDPSALIEGLDPKAYFGAASDHNAGGAAYATFGHTHRFAGGAQLKASLRHGRYDRDQRASAIRFCTRSLNAATGAVTNPDCPATLPGADTVSGTTPLTRGTNNKVQDMTTTYAQSDFSVALEGAGLKHEVLAGVDLAHEVFHGYATVLPSGVTLDKNTPRATLGAPDDDTRVDEAARIRRVAGAFDARALGVYAQDLLQLAPHWKLLGGLRYDRFAGEYRTYSTAVSAQFPLPGTETAPARTRSDGLWSKRFGLLYQPSDAASLHFSYGTSFNTSGDTYQYDDQTKNTPPEGSENLELGAKIDALDGRLSTRIAIFRATKLHERNRDPDSAATQAVLSGKRHAAGVELDIAGRIAPGWEVFASYAWTPVARIDIGAPGSTPGVGEGEGTRASLTPRHSGTLWTTWQFTPRVRLGAGLNARSAQTPNRNPAGIVAPGFVTGDLLAEVALNDAVALKLNVANVTNELYADSLYTGHYIPGAARSVQLTLTARF